MKDIKLHTVILLTLICISCGCWTNRRTVSPTRPPVTYRTTVRPTWQPTWRPTWQPTWRPTWRPTPRPPQPDPCSAVNIVSRSEWRARAPEKSLDRFSSTPVMAFVHHSDSQHCTSQTRCSTIVRGIQDGHMDDEGWDDIGYNFLVGEDGNVYEGRGWDRVGAQVKYYNSKSLGFCMLGNFNGVEPSQIAITAMQNIIQCAFDKGKLRSGFWIAGHRDCANKDCPGHRQYDIIKRWPKYRKQCP